MAQRRVADPEVQFLAAMAQTLKADYAEQDVEWEGSPFAWIKTRPSRQVGTIGEKLIAGYLAAKGFDVTRAPDSECDRVIESFRTEIKFSTLWKSGGYKFQQFRDQNYQIAICLGIKPFDAQCWVIPKAVLHQHVIGHTPQHGGRAGRDTAWLHVDVNAVPVWLEPFGGRLADAVKVLTRLAADRSSGTP